MSHFEVIWATIRLNASPFIAGILRLLEGIDWIVAGNIRAPVK
jgi:hypothetical protein